MPLPNPILDDRSYQQLRDELVRRIPVYTAEWTNHNASDPGITLIELFAFLGENLLFRFNQIPELTKLAFLNLLQIPLRAASPSRVMVEMVTEKPEGVLVPIGSVAKAGNLSFETIDEVKVWPVSLLAVARTQSATPDPIDEPEVYDFAVRALDALGPLGENETATFYESVVLSPDASGPPVNFEATVDGMLWAAVLAEKGFSLAALDHGILNIGFIPNAIVPTIDEIEGCPGLAPASTGPAVEWQVSTGQYTPDHEPLYRSVTVLADTTRGLSQQGIVRLQLPRHAETHLGVFDVSDPDLIGSRQLPPPLDDEQSEKVQFWLRAFRHDESRFGNVMFVGANAVTTRQSEKARPEFLGTGDGQPGQTYRLNHKPVLDRSLILEVEEVGGWRRWETVDSFHASGPDDRHYVVELEAGTVRFGNGIQGRPPQIGQRIRANEYRFGGGIIGNVAPKAIAEMPGVTDVKKVRNPMRAHGGSNTETIEAALDRIPGELRRRDRAVTAADFQELALATPGARVGRAECIPRFHPLSRTLEAAGVVSVVVWPQEDPQHPNAPVPDRNLLRAVCAWLDARRLVTTELYVIPPTYRKIAVAVGLHVKPGFGIEAVRRWVELVIRQYLAPLPPFGPSGGGWPLGRRVHGPELEAAALQVEGVEFLEGLHVAGWDPQSQVWVPGSVELDIYEVPELVEITVVEGAPIETPGQVIAPLPSPNVPVPVPIIREKC
jgi:hypothetical protein